MTRQEAKNILERDWWMAFHKSMPENIKMVVGDLDEEHDHAYCFDCCRCENGEEPPGDPDEWEVWWVNKKDGTCYLPIYS
jgi:hypothetical protein